MRLRIAFFALLGILFLNSCEKEFKINVPASEQKPVVEGIIENGLPPYLYLTSSLDIFSSLNAASLSNSYLHNATVTVSDGTHTIPLKEYALNFGSFTAYVYTVKGLDFTGASGGPVVNFPGLGPVGINLSKFNFGDTGKLNTDYTLSIQLENESKPSITATTRITYPSTIDSFWTEPRAGRPVTDTFVSLYARITEDGTQRNYYRYFTSVNNGRFLPGLNSVFTDDFINGTTYNVKVDRGIDRTLPDSLLFKNYSYFAKGNHITVKVCQIDKGTFDFWQTLEYASQNLGNPFAAPTNVKCNINGGYGIWSGYAALYKSFDVPK